MQLIDPEHDATVDLPRPRRAAVRLARRPSPSTSPGFRARRTSPTTRRSTKCSSRFRPSGACTSPGTPPPSSPFSGSSLGAAGLVVALARLDSRSAPPRRAADARRRRPQGPRRVRRLAAGADRRPPPRGRRGRGAASRGSTGGSTSTVANTRDRPLRRLRGHGRPPVGVARAARRGADRHRHHRDPGPRLRPDLHEGDRPRPARGRALARGAAGGRARDGPLGERAARSPRPCPLHFRHRAAGSGPERQFRAAQRVLAAPRARARLQGEGGGGRRARPTTLLGHGAVSVAARHPAPQLRPRSADRAAQDLAPRALRA